MVDQSRSKVQVVFDALKVAYPRVTVSVGLHHTHVADQMQEQMIIHVDLKELLRQGHTIDEVSDIADMALIHAGMTPMLHEIVSFPVNVATEIKDTKDYYTALSKKRAEIEKEMKTQAEKLGTLHKQAHEGAGLGFRLSR